MSRPVTTGSNHSGLPHATVPPPPAQHGPPLGSGDTMGGRTTDDSSTNYSSTAARRLRAVHHQALTPPSPTTGPGPRTTRVHSPALVDLALLDYIETAAHEVIAHTHTAVPTAGPAPHDADAVYTWAEEHIRDLDAARRRDHDALLVRQAMEHALALGDETVLRREPCPGCACWGALFWNTAVRRAVCVNRYCTDRHGRPTTWSLAHLADRHVAARESRGARNAT